MKTIKDVAHERYLTINQRTKEVNERKGFNIKLVRENDVWMLLLKSLNTGFLCHYCKQQMIVSDKYPHYKSPSVDHKKPLSSGGVNDKENLVGCCHRCNIIKGTMTYETYLELITRLNNDREFLDRLFDEMFDGRLSDKIKRCRLGEDGW